MSERCWRCGAEMEWRHGTWQCPRCRFKLGCCEGRAADGCEAAPLRALAPAEAPAVPRREAGGAERNVTANVAPAPGRAPHRDVAAHRARELLHDREAEAAPDRALLAVLVVEEEAVERVREVVRRRGPGPVSATASRPRLDDARSPTRRAASRGARSRRGSRRPGASGRGRPRPTTPSPSALSATPNSRAARLVPRDHLARDLGEVDRLAADLELAAGSSARGRAGRATSRSSRRASRRIVSAASSAVNAPSARPSA